MTYRPGKEIISKSLETASVDEIAQQLGVHRAHIYNATYGAVSPTLYKALVKVGWVDPPPRVYTLAFRFKDRAAFDRARRAVDAGGDRTEKLLEMIGDNDG